ncbi:MAG: hypothetical protein RR846_09280 [Oscillospiraceae bacterium]
MKNKICLLLLSLSIFVFASCESEDDSSLVSEFSSNDSLQNIEEHITESCKSDYYKLDEQSQISFSVSNSNFFRSTTSAEKGCLASGNLYWTTSILHNDAQLLFVDNPKTMFKDLEDRATLLSDHIQSNSIVVTVKAKDYFSESSTNYSELTNKDNVMYLSEDYEPILAKVTYIDYDDNSKSPKDTWTPFFEKALTSKTSQKAEIPIIIREAWSFDYEGKNIEIVTANNIVAKYPLDSISVNNSKNNIDISKGDIFFAYKITIIFLDGIPQKSICTVEEINKQAFEPIQGTDENYIGIHTYQKNENGDICLYPLFVTSHKAFSKFDCWDSYFFADVDNDGIGEIVYLRDQTDTNGFPLNIIIYSIEDYSISNTMFGVPLYNFERNQN